MTNGEKLETALASGRWSREVLDQCTEAELDGFLDALRFDAQRIPAARIDSRLDASVSSTTPESVQRAIDFLLEQGMPRDVVENMETDLVLRLAAAYEAGPTRTAGARQPNAASSQTSGGAPGASRGDGVDEDADPIGAVQAHNDAWQADAWARPNQHTIHRGIFPKVAR